MIKAHDAGNSVDGPDAMAFASVLNAYLSNPKTVQKGQLMMEDMLQGKFSVLPTTYSLNNLLHLFCKEGDVGSAIDLFQKMTQIAHENGFDTLPDSATFNMMANMYFKSRHEDSAARALSLLDQFEESFDAKELNELDPFVYNVIVNKLTKSESPTLRDASYDVLMRMVERYDNDQLKKEPQTYIYNMVLSSVTKKHNAEGAQKALVSALHLFKTPFICKCNNMC
jgi:pentatricopeptide repeat protein